MSSTVQEPSQAERLEDVAVAGVGADDTGNVAVHRPEKALNGSVETTSKQSDELVEPKLEAASEAKPPQAPERSKGKVALIMGSLMVRDTLRLGSLSARIANGRFRSLYFLLLLILWVFAHAIHLHCC